eukprot:507140-Pelagomonas_calceolata.AAC.1
MDLDGAWSSRWVSAPPEHGLSWVMVATRHSPVQKALEASDIALSLASKVFQLLLTPPCSSGHSYMPRLRCNRTHCKNGLRERTRTLGPGTKPMEDSSDRGSGFKIPVTATSSKMFRRISTDENNSSQRATLHEFMEEEEEKERSEEREGQASTQAPPKRRPEVVPDMSWRTRRLGRSPSVSEPGTGMMLEDRIEEGQEDLEGIEEEDERGAGKEGASQ